MPHQWGHFQILVGLFSLIPMIRSENPDARDALTKLYQSTNGGGSWIRNLNWMSSTDSCEWEGVICDDEGNVRSLILFNNSAYGTLPSEIGILPINQTLDLSQNILFGTVPVQLSYLTDAKSWDLGENYFSGTIPCEFGLLRSVTDFNMDFCRFTGTIPTWLGLLSQISDDFEISHNSLTGTIPTELGLLTLLSDDLELSHNLLRGTIPSQFGCLTALSNDFELQWNLLTGTIPSQLGSLTALGLETVNATDRFTNKGLRTAKESLGRQSSKRRLDVDDDVLADDYDDDDDDRCLYQELFPDWNLLARAITMDHTDVQGRVLSCNNVSVDTITIGGSTEQLWAVSPDDLNGGVGFRVCNTLSWTGSGEVFNGVAVVPDDAEVSPEVTFVGGSVSCPSDDPLCADEIGGCAELCHAEFSDAQDLSALLQNNSDFYNCSFPTVGTNGDGNPEILTFGLDVVADEETGATYLCVYNSQLIDATTINLHYDNGSQSFLSINVLDAETAGPYKNMSFEVFGLDPKDAFRRTVWNFYDIESLTMSGLGWVGTLVAPTAHVQCADGNYNGNLYAATYSGTCEGHWFPPIVPLSLSCANDWLEDDEHDCDFRLKYNSLTGTIPTQLGRLSELDGEFGVNDNQLTGPVPTELGLLVDLTIFNLGTNQLICDDLPTEVAALKNLSDMKVFDVSGTALGSRCCDLLPEVYVCTDDPQPLGF